MPLSKSIQLRLARRLGFKLSSLGSTVIWDLEETSDCAPQRLQVHERMCVAQGVAIHWCISMHAHNHFYQGISHPSARPT